MLVTPVFQIYNALDLNMLETVGMVYVFVRSENLTATSICFKQYFVKVYSDSFALVFSYVS